MLEYKPLGGQGILSVLFAAVICGTKKDSQLNKKQRGSKEQEHLWVPGGGGHGG